MTTPQASRPPTWKCYLNLCKSNVVIEMVFTAIVGMLLAVPGMPPLDTVVYASFGIALAAASGAALNHFFDRHVDVHLNVHRMLPMGYLTPKQVLVFAVVLGLISTVVMVLLVNTVSAMLTLVSLLGYGVVYTGYLKWVTPQNIVIGGLFGAMPPLLGWSAITGDIHPYALQLVLIIYVWTPPHFWPLAIARIEKYEKIHCIHGIPMLPVTHGEDYACLQILLYSILLLPATLLPYLTGMSGLIYLAVIVPLSLGFIVLALLMKRNKDKKTAMNTFWYSLVYITLLFAALLVDHYFKYTL